ncbi:hypothetical protein PAXRUDRAFT_473199 [Paxillus rubicundulus Ve08.2h10]|uniref:Uncharacterized protein n=1 Tax=Paxillus rubicundulus Ve08.2h10 TaxID=930991 RepID=A0A0D0DAE0_9AGAM|nr:hypothetical protein PAXRUDRAFT_473199 [Paxillus rubicundulus Ve08.2h10]
MPTLHTWFFLARKDLPCPSSPYRTYMFLGGTDAIGTNCTLHFHHTWETCIGLGSVGLGE